MRKRGKEHSDVLIILSRDAARDLDDAWQYIAREESAKAADAVLRKIAKTYRLLGVWPRLGRRRDDLASGAHSLPVRPYTIFYCVIGRTVLIVRILHQSRNTDFVF